MRLPDARRRSAAAALLFGMLTLLTGCGLAPHPAYPAGFDADQYGQQPRGWAKIADGPLSARQGAVAASTARGVLIIGGRRCAARCRGKGSWLNDGARYDPSTDRWSSITPAPLPVTSGRSILIDDHLYVTALDAHARSPERLLRYDVGEDSWARLPSPTNGPGTFLDEGGLLVAVAGSSDGRGPADLLLDPETETWTALAPADPIGASTRRRLYWADGDLVLIARPERGRSRAELAETSTIWSSRGWSDPKQLPTTATNAVLLNSTFVFPQRGRSRAADGAVYPDGGTLQGGELRSLPGLRGPAIDTIGIDNDVLIEGGVLHDGRLLEPTEDAYRPLPRFPGAARTSAAAVTTSTGALIWGGEAARGDSDLDDGWLLYP